MNTKQLQYVQVLSQEGSFGRAAERLGISQPSLSQYIKKIEQQIGISLFDRTGNEVRLTDAGRIYVETGKQILDLEHRMQNSFSDLGCNAAGSVIIGTSPYRSVCMMPPAVRRFQQIFPGMNAVIDEMTTSDLLDAAEHGQFDLCVTLGPADDRIFSWEKITEEELLLAVPAEHTPLPGKSVSDCRYPVVDLKCVNDEAFVMLQSGQWMQTVLQSLCLDYGIKPRIAAVVRSFDAQIAMVRAGVGIALVSDGVQNFCNRGDVAFYKIAGDLPKRQVIALWPKDRPLSNAARKFLNILKDGK